MEANLHLKCVGLIVLKLKYIQSKNTGINNTQNLWFFFYNVNPPTFPQNKIENYTKDTEDMALVSSMIALTESGFNKIYCD